MLALDATNCEIRIYVRRAGLLKRFGHDLELRARELEGELDPAAACVHLELAAAAVRVVSAVERREQKPALSAADAAQIDTSVASQVLDAQRYPAIVFRAERVTAGADGYRAQGTLSLRGRTRELAVHAQRRGDRLEGEFVLQQPDFGIEPFRALGGALRLEPQVEIVFSLPAPAGSR